MNSTPDNNAPAQDDAWQLAQLTAILVAQRLSRLDANVGLHLKNEAGYEPEISAAMRRARRILELSRHPEVEPVHLYQIFEEGEVFSESELVERVMSTRWVTLGDSSIRTRLKSLRESWRKLLDARRLKAGPTGLVLEHVRSQLHQCYNDLESTFEISKIVPDFSKLFEEFTRSLFFRFPLELQGSEIWELNWGEEEALYHWCIREELGTASDKATTRNYRPHELFRFTETFEWYPEEFRRKRRRDLSNELQIGPPRSPFIASFEEFHKKGWSWKRCEDDGASESQGQSDARDHLPLPPEAASHPAEQPETGQS